MSHNRQNSLETWYLQIFKSFWKSYRHCIYRSSFKIANINIIISALCRRKWIHWREAVFLFNPTQAPRLMLGDLSSHTLAETPSETAALCAQLGWPRFLFSLGFRNEMKNVFLNSTLQGKKKRCRVQEVLIESEFGFSFLTAFLPGKEDIETSFVFYTTYNIRCNEKISEVSSYFWKFPYLSVHFCDLY